MKNVEREDIISLQLETADKEGTYEQKKSDVGNQTIYSGNQKKKTKIKPLQTVIYTD